MCVENAIEKLQRITKEKEVQRSAHRQRQEEEVKLLRRIEVEEELRRVEHEGVLNIQSLVARSLPHSSSSLQCAERKVYNEKIQFTQTVTKSLVVQALQRCRLPFANSFVDQWNAKSLGLPYSIRYFTIIFIIYQKKKV